MVVVVVGVGRDFGGGIESWEKTGQSKKKKMEGEERWEMRWIDLIR